MAEMATLAVIGFDIGKDVWTPSTTLMSPCVLTIAGDVQANWAFATLVLAFDTVRCHANEEIEFKAKSNATFVVGSNVEHPHDLVFGYYAGQRADALRADPGAPARGTTLNGRRRDALYPRSPIAFLPGALPANVVYAHLNLIAHRGFGMHDWASARKADHCGHGPLQRNRSGSPRQRQ
jgi:hypothetical protein